MGRVDYYHDPHAPRANSLVPGASAIVIDEAGKILMQRRRDNDRWALPGGTMDIGETIGQSIVREVLEETGVDVRLDTIVGVYSDPGHVFVYDDGEVRQQFNICFSGARLSGEPQASDESSQADFFSAEEIEELDVHDSVRLRIRHYLEHRNRPVIA